MLPIERPRRLGDRLEILGRDGRIRPRPAEGRAGVVRERIEQRTVEPDQFQESALPGDENIFATIRLVQIQCLGQAGWTAFTPSDRYPPLAYPGQKEPPLQIVVRDNNIDQALKALKKKMQREGIFREMKLRGHYEKPSEKRARERAEAIRRYRKLQRKRMQREGLLPK